MEIWVKISRSEKKNELMSQNLPYDCEPLVFGLQKRSLLKKKKEKKFYISREKLLPISQADASGPLAERKALCPLGSLHQPESLFTLIFNLTWDSHFGCLFCLGNIIPFEFPR